MCDCIKILEEKLHERCLETSFKKPFESVEIEQAFVMTGNVMTTKTYSRAIITLTGQKKKIDSNIMHSHCPFCGEKIADPETA